MIYPYSLPPAGDLSTNQLDGILCVYCAGNEPPKPVGHIRGSQVFAHSECADAHKIGDETTRCKLVPGTPEWPYAKRCEADADKGSDYCAEHEGVEDSS